MVAGDFEWRVSAGKVGQENFVMKSLIIHIGTGKAGSSSIQAFLNINRLVLEKKCGVWLADEKFQFGDDHFGKFPISYFHELLASYELNEIYDLFDEKWNKLYNQMVRNSKSIAIVSAESLSDSVEFPNFFKSASKYFKVKVIGYFRPQVDWIPSAWKQWHLKAGMSLDDFIDRCVANKHPEYLSNFIAWENRFNKENLHIKPLVRNYLSKSCLIQDFAQAAGIANDDLNFDVPVVNISYQSSILRIIAKSPCVFNGMHDCSLDKFFENQSDITTSKEKEYLLTIKQHRMIYDSFYDMNREIHQRYFPEFDFDLIFKSDQLQERNEFSIVDDLTQVCAIQFKLLQILDSRFDAINPINERLNYIDERLNYIDEQINKIRKGPLKRMAARFSNSIKKRIKVQ
jgi:hypothetical protein